MDFLKKNYEKVLLSAVLLGLVVAVAFLPFKISSEKQKLEDMISSLSHPKVKPLPSLELAPQEAALKLMANPAPVNFSAPNRLLNPMLWQKAADGHLIKVDATNIGPNALVITKLTPLYLKLTLDEVVTLDTGPRYKIGVEKEAAVKPSERTKTQKYCSVGTKNETFTLRDVKAAPDNPTNVTAVLELNDTGQRVNLSKDQPFKRIDGYMADIKYPPESKIFPSGRRVDATLTFSGEEYKIVAITENELVLSAKSNQKKWTVKHSAGPAS
jgi:hypothetical protein